MYAIQKPDFGAEEEKVYGEALDALDTRGVRYLLGGALAMNAHTGLWHKTKDLDLFVPLAEVPRVLETLEGAGFETGVEDPVWLHKAWKGDYFADVVHATHNGTNPVDESWFENAGEMRVFGRQAPVAPAEEAILSKMFVIAKDRSDVDDVLHTIFATRGDLDWDRILQKVGEHWEVLLAHLHLYRYAYPSHAHYIPRRVMSDLMERYENSAPPEETRFRGTMLDPVSFAVDVEEWGLPDERARVREAAQKGDDK